MKKHLPSTLHRQTDRECSPNLFVQRAHYCFVIHRHHHQNKILPLFKTNHHPFIHQNDPRVSSPGEVVFAFGQISVFVLPPNARGYEQFTTRPSFPSSECVRPFAQRHEERTIICVLPFSIHATTPESRKRRGHDDLCHDESG